ncbi:hypothetical protein C8R44DRAFT_857705 [Mycena epipterygia]|nr:hypothetical protein C8R44DRAFT_857705 [Mycena epipterygia]
MRTNDAHEYMPDSERTAKLRRRGTRIGHGHGGVRTRTGKKIDFGMRPVTPALLAAHYVLQNVSCSQPFDSGPQKVDLHWSRRSKCSKGIRVQSSRNIEACERQRRRAGHELRWEDRRGEIGASSFLLHLAVLQYTPFPSCSTRSPSPPALHAHTPAPRPVPVHPHPGAHRHRARDPTARSSARGPCARAAGEPRPADGGGGTSAASSFSTAWACWGRGACIADAGNAGCSSADVDPEAPVLTLDMALELLAVDQSLTRGESKSCACLVLVLRFGILIFLGVLVSRDEYAAPARDPAADVPGAHVAVRPPGGGLLLSGDDLELEIRGLAPASREFPDLWAGGATTMVWAAQEYVCHSVSARICSKLRFSGVQH